MKILLPLSHALHDRNWIASGAAEILRQRGHIVLTHIPPRPRYAALRGFLRLGSLVSREPTSRTYRFKLAQPRNALQRVQIGAWRAYRRVGDPEVLAARIEAALPVSRPAWDAIQGTRPDLVLLPTMIHMDAWDNDLIKSARGAEIPVLAVPASWDSLTSKGGFLAHPNGLLVWGEASKRHAMQSHGFKPEEIAVTGPPQFDVYHEPRPAWPPSLVLVAGTTVNYWAEEREMVASIQRESPFPVVHRPHPRAGGNWSWGAMLRLRDQLDSALCVVTAFSTVVIEAALLGKPSLLVGFGESAHGPGGVAYHRELEHMAEVATWPMVYFCRSQRDILDILWHLRQMHTEPHPDTVALLRRRAQEVARSDGQARERIAVAVETFVAHGHF